MISVRAKSLNKAVENALDSLNFFRGILNFIINFGVQTFSFGGANQKPINRILLGPTHTLHKPNGEIAVKDGYWFEREYREPIQLYYETSVVNSIPKFESIIKNVSKIQKILKKSKMREELQNAILLYNNALDSYDYESSYIKLWAVLELLTATGQDDNHKVTIRRAAHIFRNPEREKTSLELLRNFRNNLVHRGYITGKLEIFLYNLKLYVEMLLRFLIFNQSRFENFNDVGYLLDKSLDLDKLNKESKLINYAKKINKARKLN